MIDSYKDNHVGACVRAFVNFFFQKTSQNLLFIVTEKSGLWSDTGAQVPLVPFPTLSFGLQ